jgi:hypothetical protein
MKEAESLWLKPLKILHNFFMSQSRLIGPMIAAFGLLELLRATRRRDSQTLQVALAAGGTGAVYALVVKSITACMCSYIFSSPQRS